MRGLLAVRCEASAPFALGDRSEVVALFESGGIPRVSVRTERGTGRFPSIRSMVEADLRGWMPMVGVVLEEDLILRILKDSEGVLAPWVIHGEVRFDMPAHILSGTKS